ncbi:hypothetical protein Q6A49_01405 [Pseudomonas sp. 22-AL-CL-001]|uniref:hypothetical protein n=1 Tax=Pseudomonas alabamensis TaxID=3064349 RepID=UPI002713263B|nr:hypothetical protein [Pseudomonas sp. 22-AL-CL-001]MDO7909190.1 hypothetical protein [Pseudomonas sp. 22-AL-CL-001]
MKANKYIYGSKVVEFFKHDEAELDELLGQRVSRYNANSEGLHFREPAANIDWIRDKPINIALLELQDEWRKGYTLISSQYHPLDFRAQLRKPEKVIKSELLTLADQVRADYDKSRYERNAAETERQVGITLSIKRRKEEAKAAAGLAAALAALQEDEEAALADLRRAYAEPVELA